MYNNGPLVLYNPTTHLLTLTLTLWLYNPPLHQYDSFTTIYYSTISHYTSTTVTLTLWLYNPHYISTTVSLQYITLQSPTTPLRH